MATRLSLHGTIKSDQGWVTTNWPRVLRAHAPTLDGFIPGTLNVQLESIWVPPNDLEYFERARALGRERRQQGQTADDGVDFLECGNYIHPDITVVVIAGVAVHGLPYYAGSNTDQKPTRNRLEFFSKEFIRGKLNLGPADVKDVTLVVEIRD